LPKAAKSYRPEVGRSHVRAEYRLSVEAFVNQLPDTTYIPTADIPLKVALALFLQRAGITREGSVELLVDSMREALELGEKGAPHLESRISDIEMAMAKVTAVAKKLPKKARKGALRVEGKLEITAVQSTVEELK